MMTILAPAAARPFSTQPRPLPTSAAALAVISAAPAADPQRPELASLVASVNALQQAAQFTSLGPPDALLPSMPASAPTHRPAAKPTADNQAIRDVVSSDDDPDERVHP